MDFPYKDSVCVGVKNKAELDFAVGVLCSDISVRERERLESTIGDTEKVLVVEDWCQGCGRCEENRIWRHSRC